MVCAYLVTIYNLCIHGVLRYRCRKWLKDISNLLQATWCGMNSYLYIYIEREREVGPCLQIHWTVGGILVVLPHWSISFWWTKNWALLTVSMRKAAHSQSLWMSGFAHTTLKIELRNLIAATSTTCYFSKGRHQMSGTLPRNQASPAAADPIYFNSGI